MRLLGRFVDWLFPDVPTPVSTAPPASRPARHGDAGVDADHAHADADAIDQAARDAMPISGGAAKPPAMSIEAHVERQIEKAREAGKFRNLPLHGKPIPDLQPDDPGWWIRRKLKDEGLEMPLPPALELKRDLKAELERISRIPDESIARRELDRLNERIRRVNSRSVAGPATTIAPLDVDAILRRRSRDR